MWRLWTAALVLLGAVAFPAGRGAQEDASKFGAASGPEPFRSHPEWCAFGSYGDLLPDAGIGHETERWAYRLCTWEAVQALREGDLRKACFIASWATNYLLDKSCVACAEVWSNDFGVISRLPSRYWDVRAPTERREADGEALFFLCPPPEFKRDAFEKCQGKVRAFFEAAFGGHMEGLDLKAVPPTEGWSLYDAWLVASWASEILALETLDLDAVREGRPRFKPAAALEAIARSERLLQVWLCAVHYSYVAEAAKFGAENLGPLSGEDGLDRLASMGRPVVAVPSGAPAGIERAATLIAVELRKALKRAGAKEVPPLWRMVRREEDLSSLPGPVVAVVLATPKSRLARGCGLRLGEGLSGLVSFVKRGLPRNVKGAVFLLAADEGRIPHLADFFLDLSMAPLFGRGPGSKVLGALKERWAGWKLLVALRERSGEEAVGLALKPPFENSPADARDFKAALADETEPGGAGELWDALVPLPVPGGEGRTWDFVKSRFLSALRAR